MSSEGKKAKGKQKLKDGGKKKKKKGAKEDDGAELTDHEESDEDDGDGMSHSKLNPTPHDLVEFAKTHMSRNYLWICCIMGNSRPSKMRMNSKPIGPANSTLVPSGRFSRKRR